MTNQQQMVSAHITPPASWPQGPGPRSRHVFSRETPTHSRQLARWTLFALQERTARRPDRHRTQKRTRSAPPPIGNGPALRTQLQGMPVPVRLRRGRSFRDEPVPATTVICRSRLSPGSAQPAAMRCTRPISERAFERSSRYEREASRDRGSPT